MPLLEFLKLVLPVEGLKCVAIFQGKRVVHKFTPSFEEMAQIIQTADVAGHTVYHACASYATADNRKASNVLAVKSFWHDIDAGPGKPFADQQEAAEAILQFCHRRGFPAPCFVSSGSGVHTYWPLDKALEPAVWRNYASQFKQLLDFDGVAVDGARACDLASILRPPSTHNRKGDNETIVRWGGSVGPYRLEELGELNESVVRVQSYQQPLPALRSAAGGATRRSLIANALTVYGDRPQYAERIVEHCAQIREVRTRAGRVAEPHWYAALGVLAHCTDGEGYAHQWSSGYPGYTHQETQGRLQRSLQFGPTTCAKFAQVNAKGCEGCAFLGQVTSPIQLSDRVDAVRQLDHEGEANGLRGQPDVLDEQVGVEGLQGLPKLPGDFRWHGRSLAFVTETSDGEDLCEVVSTYPLYLKSVQTGEINGESFGLCFGLELPNEKPKEIVLGAKTIFASSGISEICGKGAIIHDSDLFKRYVREAVDMFNADNKLDKRFEQYGWKDDGSFLFGPSLYIGGETQPIMGADEVKIRNQWLGPNKGGEIGRWSRAANSLFTKGCEPQSFALLAGFAAPLMRFHSTGEGGSIISLVNDQSGTGKTTALEAVESVWGRKEALRLTDDDTRVSKSLILGVLANLPVTWDELYNRDPEKIREFVLMFTNGRDKMRGTQDGGLRHNKASWQTILVLASNNSIVDILSTGAGSDAPAFRVMEFQTEIPKGIAQKGDEMKRLLRDNSGLAGDAYLRLLTQPAVLSFIIEALPKWTEQVWKKTNLNNEHRFWVRTIASVMAAGVVVNKLGILDFSTDRIVDWAMENVGGMRATAAASKADPCDVFARFLAESMTSTLVVASAWKPKVELRPLIEPRRELQVRYEKDTKRVYVNEYFMRKWLVENNVSIREFLRRMKELNVLLKDGRRITLGAGTDYASGQSTCFEIDGANPLVRGGVRIVEEATPPINQREERIARFEKELGR